MSHPNSLDSPSGYRRTWASVDLDRIVSNYSALRALAGRDAAVLPVVKANAYGHGATAIARRLETEGASGFCVALPEEGLELRRSGVTAPILCLGAVEPHQVPAAARSRITLSLYSPEQLAIFEAAGRASGVPVQFHLKIETGMNRLGLLPEELGPFIEELRSCRSALLCGLFSNLACADRPGEASNAQQGERLTAAAAAVRASGHDPRPVHLANSAGLLYHPALRFDAVRPGLLLYGVRPGPGDSGPGFQPALTLATTVLRVKSAPAGTAVGYGSTYRTQRESRLATLAIGYDDGLPRSLSGKGDVLVHGRRAPLVGMISMDLSVADVTDCPEVQPGDVAVVIGSQDDESISVTEIAEKAGTIPWEILCGIGRRVPRVLGTSHELVSLAAVLPPVKDVAMSADTARIAPKPKRVRPSPEGAGTDHEEPALPSGEGIVIPPTSD